MTAVDSRWLLAVAGAPRWLFTFEWTADLVNWQSGNVVSASPVADRGSVARWTCNATVTGVPVDDTTGLHPWGCRFRLKAGLQYRPCDVAWVGLGVYRVTDRTRTLADGTVLVDGESLEAQVAANNFQTARQVGGGTAQQTVEALVREAVPDAVFRWLPGVDAGMAVPISTVDADTSPMDVIEGSDASSASVMRALGAEFYCDSGGVFVAAPIPSVKDTPTRTVDTGRGGVIVSEQEVASAQGVFNIATVIGSRPDGTTPVGPFTAIDDDPTSPTYVKGPFGPRPAPVFTSQVLRSPAAVKNAAAARLRNYLGLQKQVSYTRAVDFSMEPGEVTMLRLVDGRLQAHITDRISFGIDGESATADVDTRALLLSGADAPPVPAS